MNFPSFQAQVADSSEPCSSVFAPSDMSNGMTTANESLPPESMTESCPTPPSLAISKHSSVKGTPTAIRVWLMSLPPASPVSPSALPESRRGPRTNGTNGPPRQPSLELSVPDSVCWKMCPASAPTCPWLSETCADLGMKFQDPSSLGLTTLGRRTEGNGCGYLHTPHGMSGDDYDGHSSELGQQVKIAMLPTPNSNDGGSMETNRGEGTRLKLAGAVSLLPTPRSEDSQCCGAHRGEPDSLTAVMKMRPTPSAGGQSGDTRPHGNRSPSTGAVIGMLPTPRSGKTTDETEEAWTARQQAGKVSTPPLGLAINMAPTPSASMVTMQDFVQAKFHSSKRPRYAEAMLPTPTKQDGENNGGASQYERNTPPLNAVCGPKNGLKLQPAFVEWMMGWPIGFTDLKPLEMDRFRSAWLQPSASCLEDDSE